VLGVFNMLPAFPMDGGRVLRGLLVKPFGAERATRVATTLGKVMAGVFALVGILGFNILLVLIAGFIYIGASGEQMRLSHQGALRGLSVADVMSGRVGVARADEPAGDVARRLLRHDLVGARVVRDGSIGVVTAFDLAKRASRGEAALPIASAVRTDLPHAHAGDDAERTLSTLASGEVPAVVVTDDAETDIIGLVTPADLERAAALEALPADRRA
jgi:CBS domain-containing protein